MNRDALELQQLAHAGAQPGIVLDDQDAAHPLREPLLQISNGLDQILAFDRFARKAHGSQCQCRLGVVAHRHHVDRDVSRIRIALQSIEQGQARTVGKVDVQQNAVRRQLARQRHPFVGGGRNRAVEVELVREIEENPGERHIVLDDENEAVRDACARWRSSATADRLLDAAARRLAEAPTATG